MGDLNDNPTNKECLGAKSPTRIFQSFKQSSTDPAVMFSSTGSIRRTEPTYLSHPRYNLYAIDVTPTTASVATTCHGRYGEWGNYLAV